jgi:hypothetical protein
MLAVVVLVEQLEIQPLLLKVLEAVVAVVMAA